jgi:hypothetical protein
MDVDSGLIAHLDSGDFLDLVPSWELETVQYTERYACLELITARGTVPIAPLYLDAFTLHVALPAEVTPWLPTFTVRLASLETAAESSDGMCVTVSALAVAASSAAALTASTSAQWVADGRWPAAASLESIPVAQEVSAPEGLQLIVDLTHSMPPTQATLTPEELDAAFLGGFFTGPWAGYASLVYPPVEPE